MKYNSASKVACVFSGVLLLLELLSDGFSASTIAEAASPENAGHFSLNGYARKTNPSREQENLLSFSQGTASETSTANSVPAMFSFMDPEKFTPEKASAQSNVLDIMKRAGINVYWIENNSRSKGVANRIETIDLRKNPDPTAPLYSDGGYFDEALVTYLDQCIDKAPGDVLVVMHTMGSHGPTYHKRYPDAFAQFTPDCHGNSPQECETDTAINAYDNTILYTDFVLSGLIAYLKNRTTDSERYVPGAARAQDGAGCAFGVSGSENGGTGQPVISRRWRVPAGTYSNATKANNRSAEGSKVPPGATSIVQRTFGALSDTDLCIVVIRALVCYSYENAFERRI